MPAAAQTLDYASTPESRQGASRFWLVCLLLASSPGLFVPFLHFTWGVSPVEAVKETVTAVFANTLGEEYLLVILAVGLLVPLLLWCWQLRLALSPRIETVERVVVLCAALLLGLATLGFSANLILHWVRQGAVDADSLCVLTAPLGALAGIPILLRLRGSAASYAMPKALLLLVYVSNASIALIGFADSRDPGWWVTLFLVAVWSADLGMLVARRR